MKTLLETNRNPMLHRLLQGRLHDPFTFLGLHRQDDAYVIRVYAPLASKVWLRASAGDQALLRKDPSGLFEWHGTTAPAHPYQLKIEIDGEVFERYDAYAFPPQMNEHDLHLFNEGRLQQGYRLLGAQHVHISGVAGVRFAVWAPNAERVSVVGDFNHWDGRVNPMRGHGSSGVWELFMPDMPAGSFYKFEIRNRYSGAILVKSDPYAQQCQVRPGTASIVPVDASYEWHDQAWMTKRAAHDWLHAPLTAYELHAGSWRRHPDGRFYSYRELAQALLPYIQEMGYTHIELMPLTEHPLDESWGYQTTGYFAATSRYGSPADLRYFIDACHQGGIGVILDWVPAHFPQDSFALAHFDGTALYEHEDPRLGFHQDWGTHIFNYGRNEVKSFLLSSAHFWMAEFHIDGLRVDAVASMIYLDYSRKAGEWLPNQYGGRENLEAIEFLRALNIMVHEDFPGALTCAEESTAWPMVSRPVYLGGLGFSMKWNMGWMNDTLVYMANDPVHRRYHHNQLTFSQVYAYTENFILPFSHDEVVHGKLSLLDKMPGDVWQKFANLRLLFTYQMTCPGKKINFMGNELAQGREWQVQWELDWGLLETHWHQGIKDLCRDLNHLYTSTLALHDLDFSQDGFTWIDCHDADQSVLSYLRHARDGSFVVVALNFTPVTRLTYRIGVPEAGVYYEKFNSDSRYYSGSDAGNGTGLVADELPWMGFSYSVTMLLPPLAGVILSKSK